MVEPTLRPAPTDIRGFRVRLDLEGDDGLMEDDVRLDQLVAAEGDEVWYEYDFGDGWDHVLRVEEVPDVPPPRPRCTDGRMPCPPEDCGGMGGYAQLASWVRGGYADTLLPEVFEKAEHAHDWPPIDWHPDHFHLDEVNGALSVAVAEPVPVTGELAELAEQLDRRGVRTLRQVLGRPLSHASAEVNDAEAARLTETYRVFLEVIGDGVTLTGAGYLPPAVVQTFAERRWRPCAPPHVPSASSPSAGAASRRRQSAPAAGTTHRRCGSTSSLVYRWARRSSNGTPAGSRSPSSAVGRRPRSCTRRSATSCSPSAGGRTDDHYSPPSAHSPTLVALEQLAGTARLGRRRAARLGRRRAARLGRRRAGADLAVAATARAMIRRG